MISLLNSHPLIEARGEILQRRREDGTYAGIIEQGFRGEAEGIRAVGFKIFYYHPLEEQGTEVWNLLTSMPDLHVLHLKRRNILRTLISRKIAEQTRVWHRMRSEKSKEELDRRVEFEAAELRKGFEVTSGWEVEGDQMFANHPILEVIYENLVEDTHGTFERITEFLGVEPVVPRTQYVRQNPEPMRNLVRNYDELKDAFTGTRWERFFV